MKNLFQETNYYILKKQKTIQLSIQSNKRTSFVVKEDAIFLSIKSIAKSFLILFLILFYSMAIYGQNLSVDNYLYGTSGTLTNNTGLNVNYTITKGSYNSGTNAWSVGISSVANNYTKGYTVEFEDAIVGLRTSANGLYHAVVVYDPLGRAYTYNHIANNATAITGPAVNSGSYVNFNYPVVWGAMQGIATNASLGYVIEFPFPVAKIEIFVRDATNNATNTDVFITNSAYVSNVPAATTAVVNINNHSGTTGNIGSSIDDYSAGSSGQLVKPNGDFVANWEIIQGTTTSNGRAQYLGDEFHQKTLEIQFDRPVLNLQLIDPTSPNYGGPVNTRMFFYDENGNLHDAATMLTIQRPTSTANVPNRWIEYFENAPSLAWDDRYSTFNGPIPFLVTKIEVFSNAQYNLNYVTQLIDFGTTSNTSGLSVTANDDSFTNQTAGGTTPTVFTNDDADGTTPATDSLVTTPTVISDGGLTGITFNADGTANIPSNATVGTYNVVYQICLEAAISTCDQATVAITVINSCDPIISGNPDSDNDGITDVCDLDDDNDGILDIDEQCDTIIQNTPFNSSNGQTVSFTLDALGEGFILDITSLDNSFSLNINGTNLTSQEIEFEMSPQTIRFKDGDTYSSANVPAIWQLSGTAQNPIVRLEVKEDGTVNFYGSKTSNGSLQELELYNGNTLNNFTWNSNGTNTFTISQIVAGPTNIAGSVYGYYLIDCDYDNDNIPNRIDLDSDNDGCPDAIEGGASFTNTNIDNNDRLTGGIDANGIPTVATVGQAIGTSQDSTSQDTNCSSITANDDNFTGVLLGSITPTVFTNDDADGTIPAIDALVTTPTVISDGGLVGISFNADGTANIPSNATVGTYNIVYEVCLENSTSTCSQATMTVSVICDVIAPEIIRNK